MKDYFLHITQTIGLKQFQCDHANNLFEDHPSIENDNPSMRIESNLDSVSDKFHFKKVHEKEVKQEIMNLNSKKSNMPRCYTSQNS